MHPQAHEHNGVEQSEYSDIPADDVYALEHSNSADGVASTEAAVYNSVYGLL